MKKIKPLHDFAMPGQGFTKDEEVEVHDDTAELLVGRGHAVLVEPPQQQELAANAEPQPEPNPDSPPPSHPAPPTAEAPPPLPADRGQEH